MTILYFTTTGNSLAVAKQIGGRLVSIPQAIRNNEHTFADCEAIGIVSPVYFGHLPLPVGKFLDNAKIDSPYIFCILTCGSTPATAPSQVQDIRNIRWDYIRSIEMVDNYFPMFDVGKQIELVPRKHISENIYRIITDIRSRRHHMEVPDLYGRIASLYMNIFPLSPNAYKRFYTRQDRCNNCGICSHVCPIANITMTTIGPEIGADCLTCGSCYHNCPRQAIRYRGEKSKISYRNPSVSLAEIIKSNDQIN